jgi:hypothetical protein
VARDQELAAQHDGQLESALPPAQLGLTQRDRILVLAFCNDLGNFVDPFLLSRTFRPQRSRFCGLISFLDRATSFRQIQRVDQVALDALCARSRNLGCDRRFDVVEPSATEKVSAAIPAGGRCKRRE